MLEFYQFTENEEEQVKPYHKVTVSKNCQKSCRTISTQKIQKEGKKVSID